MINDYVPTVETVGYIIIKTKNPQIFFRRNGDLKNNLFLKYDIRKLKFNFTKNLN